LFKRFGNHQKGVWVMSGLIGRILDLGNEFLGRQPVLALALGGALAALFLTTVLRRSKPTDSMETGIGWAIYRQLGRLVWAGTLVVMVGWSVMTLQSYLDRTLSNFRHNHGRITDVNFHAVRTIWGTEQVQSELGVTMTYEEETTERIESEDLSRPAVLRKKTLTHTVTANPFLTSRHVVTIKKNPRKKGSAVYAGYETDNRFHYLLRNPADREVKAVLRFPLPSSSAIYNDLTVNLNQTNALGRMRVESGALVLEEKLAAGVTVDFEVSFKSRGLSYWYFQVRESREIRDFELIVNLPDFPQRELNYPEGCMTPTKVEPAGTGSRLVFQLDRALSNKGMGVAMPKLEQPGEVTAAVLSEAGKGWVLMFAAVLLGGVLTNHRWSALTSVMIGSAAAFGFGLLGDISESFLGFWGTAAVIALPMFLVLGGLILRTHGHAGKIICAELILFGLVYPCLAGMDSDRQTLYLNLAGLLFLMIAAWLFTNRIRSAESAEP
jgi:hypothetical protein